MVFALYCLRVLDSLISAQGSALHWSPLRDAPHYGAFDSAWSATAHKMKDEGQTGLYVPHTVSITLAHAADSTALVLSNVSKRIDTYTHEIDQGSRWIRFSLYIYIYLYRSVYISLSLLRSIDPSILIILDHRILRSHDRSLT
jgi:hypothetical protein